MTRIEITRLGHHGDGIAAGPVFAAKTLPGEVIEGDVEGDRIAVRISKPVADALCSMLQTILLLDGRLMSCAPPCRIKGWMYLFQGFSPRQINHAGVQRLQGAERKKVFWLDCTGGPLVHWCLLRAAF
jgi:hypothetical protein